MRPPGLSTFRLRNFKAVRDSGPVRFGPITVFIGNNGSGKSSLLEGIGTLQRIVDDGLDEALDEWRGFEFIHNKSVKRSLITRGDERPYYSNPIDFEVRGRSAVRPFSATVEVAEGPGGNEVFIRRERVVERGFWEMNRNDRGEMGRSRPSMPVTNVRDGESILRFASEDLVSTWQFLSLDPRQMGQPRQPKRTGGAVRLSKDGSNIAEYLEEFRRLDLRRFNGLIETLQYVVPYARDLQPEETAILGRLTYLQMTEADFKVPGWLLSTGTLRVVALLALLRHPAPPPVIFIEEIENGLDPRTIHLLVEEIRSATEAGATQVVATTHSPYLLDLLHLSQIVLVERVDGQPTFTRPAEQASLAAWRERFGPGQLYTMGRLGRATSQ